MSTTTSIEWTDATWTPIKAMDKFTNKVGWHCEKVSDGCKHCYSETFNGRMLPNGGTGLPYSRQSREAVDIFIDEKTLTQPLRWKKPRRVFVCSMTDLFAEFVPFEFIDRVFAVMALCPEHTFQLLTKRPERMAEYLYYGGPKERSGEVVQQCARMLGGLSSGEVSAAVDDVCSRGWPLPNVMLGTSVENQQQADARIPHLLRCPAAVRFLSMEPLLGAVNLRDVAHIRGSGQTIIDSLTGRMPNAVMAGKPAWPALSWVIIGGESGPGARPCNVAWIRSIVEQCKAAGVPCFVKQLGARPIYAGPERKMLHNPDGTPTGEEIDVYSRFGGIEDRKGGDPSEWPEDLRVREMPQIGGGA